MNIFYHKQTRRPFIFEMDSDEVGTIIYHLHDQKQKIEQSIIFGESMQKIEGQDYKAFLREHRRNLKNVSKILDEYEVFRKEFTGQKS